MSEIHENWILYAWSDSLKNIWDIFGDKVRLDTAVWLEPSRSDQKDTEEHMSKPRLREKLGHMWNQNTPSGCLILDISPTQSFNSKE